MDGDREAIVNMEGKIPEEIKHFAASYKTKIYIIMQHTHDL